MHHDFDQLYWTTSSTEANGIEVQPPFEEEAAGKLAEDPSQLLPDQVRSAAPAATLGS
jgi:hypothetical protein